IPHLRGITPGGKIYLVAENSRSVSEFVISCFPPDGSVLVKKIQGEGLTLAFNGSWNTRA
ncbi:MAG: phosphatase, partial [Akkermansiaceae bacterium]